MDERLAVEHQVYCGSLREYDIPRDISRAQAVLQGEAASGAAPSTIQAGLGAQVAPVSQTVMSQTESGSLVAPLSRSDSSGPPPSQAQVDSGSQVAPSERSAQGAEVPVSSKSQLTPSDFLYTTNGIF